MQKGLMGTMKGLELLPFKEGETSILALTVRRDPLPAASFTKDLGAIKQNQQIASKRKSSNEMAFHEMHI